MWLGVNGWAQTGQSGVVTSLSVLICWPPFLGAAFGAAGAGFRAASYSAQEAMSFHVTLTPLTAFVVIQTFVMWMRWCLSRLVNLFGVVGMLPLT